MLHALPALPPPRALPRRHRARHRGGQRLVAAAPLACRRLLRLSADIIVAAAACLVAA